VGKYARFLPLAVSRSRVAEDDFLAPDDGAGGRARTV